MKILLTNDDGYNAPGLKILYDVLSRDHEVVLAAPDREKSAAGHAITLNEPLRMEKISLGNGTRGYAIKGTPADCVKLGLSKVLDSLPDMVISGINPGCNTGININYSGTVAAAREAALNGVLGIAVSIRRGDAMDFKGVAEYTARLAGQVHARGLPPGTFLNVNAPDIPMDRVKGTRVTRQALSNLSNLVETKTDPRGRPYFWYGGISMADSESDTDVSALADQYISITPIRCDTTDYAVMADLEKVRAEEKYGNRT